MELVIDRVTKQFKNKLAVDKISLRLQPGVYGLLGANGAGKTTLMRMLCAILESTSGEVLLNGKEVTAMGADYRNVLGYLPQDFGYYPNYTAMEFLMYVAVLKGIPKNIAKNRAKELLEVADVEGASAAHKFFHIKLRYLSPTVLFVTILSMINCFKIFREVYLLAGAYPYEGLYTLQHFMNNTFRNLDYQKLSAAAIIMASVITIIIGILFIAENKIGEDAE